MKDVKEFIKSRGIGKYIENASLKEYTTYKVGGKARFIVFPKNTTKLIELLKYLRQENILNMILGFGSNVLFSDQNYDGVIIKLDELNEIEIEGTKVRAGAGASLMRVASLCIRRGLTGDRKSVV